VAARLGENLDVRIDLVALVEAKHASDEVEGNAEGIEASPDDGQAARENRSLRRAGQVQVPLPLALEIDGPEERPPGNPRGHVELDRQGPRSRRCSRLGRGHRPVDLDYLELNDRRGQPPRRA
jgi:hypothetical protein